MRNAGGIPTILPIKKFENNCTNFISQCLHAGGAPMRGYPNRGSGWWLQNKNWSYSWAVAHSLRLYLLILKVVYGQGKLAALINCYWGMLSATILKGMAGLIIIRL